MHQRAVRHGFVLEACRQLAQFLERIFGVIVGRALLESDRLIFTRPLAAYEPPLRKIAASKVSCGAKPVRTCFSVRAAPVL